MIRTTVMALLLLCTAIWAEAEAQGVTGSPEKQYQTALQQFQQGIYTEAMDGFRRVTETTGNRAMAESSGYYLVLATARVEPVMLERRTEWFVRQFPHSRRAADLLKEVGHHKLEAGAYRSAIEWFERAVERPMSRRQRTELLYQMGDAAALDGDTREARSYFMRLADEDPGSVWAPRALYARGRLFLEEQRYEESAEAFELLRQRYPEDAMTRRIGTALGESYYLQRRYREAIDALTDATPDLGGESLTRAVYLIAESHNMLDELEQAQQYYRYYLNRVEDPDTQRIAYYGLGWVYHKQEIYHWAAQSFERAADGEDETARKALYYQAVNHKLSGSYRQALETFRLFGDRYQEGLFVEEAYYEWALTAVEAGRYVEAIDILLPMARRADELRNPGPVITLLGEAYFGNAEYTRALEAFEIADQIDGVDPETRLQARFQRAWVRYSNQAYSQAQGEFQAVYEEAPQDSDLRAEALFWSADSRFETQHFGPASSQFASFVRQYPEHELTGAAKYSLGWSHFKMGQFAEAIPPLVDFLENHEPPSISIYPYETDVILRIGDSHFGMGAYTDAMEYYNRAIGAEPGGDYAMFQVANSYYRMNRNFEAVTEFRRVLRIYPFSRLREQAQYNIAYIYLNTENYDQAITEFQTVIERYPDTEWAARSQYNIGDAYYNAGEYEAAVEAYQVVLDRYPRSSYVLEAIDGIQYARTSAGEDDTSMEQLEAFLQENPASGTADQLRYRQAMNRYQSGDYEASVQEFEQYIRITNRDELLPDAWYNLADSQRRIGETASAMESLETLANDYPESQRSALALTELGEMARQRGELDRAEGYYQELEQKGGNFQLPARVGLAEVSLMRGNLQDAGERFEAILEQDGEHAAARVGLARIAFERGDAVSARELAQGVADENSMEEGAEALYLVGRTWQLQERWSEAREAYSQVEVLFEPYTHWMTMAKYRTAEILLRENRRGDAIVLLEELVEEYSGTEASRLAERLLNNR
ncbi:MAG: tetratricopeptide repeat protein [Balneolaceae bacterium]